MNKEKPNINSKLVRNMLLRDVLLRDVLLNSLVMVLASVFLFTFCSLSVASNEDYEAGVKYAKEQGRKAKEIIVPYKTEVAEIIKTVSTRQSQPDIQAFKTEITNIAKNQCSGQYQDANSASMLVPEAAPVPIMIFVSFSMSKESIKGWIAQAKKIGAAVYIRGLVNNSFKDTTKAVLELIQDQPGGLLIDPTLFKKYSIAQVPAVVVTSGNSFDVVYGDVTLDYALESISKAVQVSESKYLLDAIKKVRSKNMTQTAVVKKESKNK